MSINRVVCSGNLTRDPELRQTQTGTSVLTFGMAVNDRQKNSQTGEWEDYPNFIDCTLFGARADGLSKHLHKGIKVVIDGRLRWSQWERDGQKRSKIEIIVESLDFASAKNQQQNPQSNPQPQANVAPAPVAPAQSYPQNPQPVQQPVAQPQVQPQSNTGFVNNNNAAPMYDDIPF